MVDGAAGLAILVGSVGSVALTLYAGQRNPSLVLRAIFALWVVAPFVVATAVTPWLRSGSTWRPAVADGVVVALAAFSLGVYARTVFGPSRPHMAFVFLITPAASLAILGLAVIIGRWQSDDSRPRDAR